MWLRLTGNRLSQSGIGLQGTPKRFPGGIVVAITSAAHAAVDAGRAERRDVVAVDILAAAIRVMEASSGGLPTLEGVGEGRQIDPSFRRFQVGAVGQRAPMGAKRALVIDVARRQLPFLRDGDHRAFAMKGSLRRVASVGFVHLAPRRCPGLFSCRRCHGWSFSLPLPVNRVSSAA